MVGRAEIQAKIAELEAQMRSTPAECEGCSAPLVGDSCAYCGRIATEPAPLLDEPPDIRKTNASDDPCPMCQTVHDKDPNAPILCRCLYCGQIGPVAMSTHDARMGTGVVCRSCCGVDARTAAPQAQMPWESQ